ncbi:MAG: hypothetical protein GX386_00530 [Clostridiaceae bacterium]|nr:hypothetical protein [Clostridiaceae bacterium]
MSYEQSATDTLGMVTQYIDLIKDTVESKMIELVMNTDITSYVSGRYNDNPAILQDKKAAIISTLSTVVHSGNYIKNIYIIPGDGEVLSTMGSKASDFYNEFESIDIKNIEASAGGKMGWVGEHSILDDSMSIDMDSYAYSYIRQFGTGTGYIVMDLDREKITEILTALNFAEGRYISFITEDRREVSTASDGFTFMSQPWYQNAIKGLEANYSDYIMHNNQEYLFMLHKSMDESYIICVAIPKATVMESAIKIKTTTFLFVIIAILLSGLLGVIITMGIEKPIQIISHKLAEVAKGKLNVDMNIKSRNEFSIVAKSAKNMIDNTRNLVAKVFNISNSVTNSIYNVEQASINIIKASNDTTYAIEQIDQGISHQAKESQICYHKMDELSNKMKVLNGDINNIQNLTDETQLYIQTGMNIMENLTEQSKKTGAIMEKLLKDIDMLRRQSASIGQFVSIIDGIAQQTNLLSLNASIEAARAGDAGRGFSVVAEEIRKLAEDSMKEAKKIQDVVTDIDRNTISAVISSQEAGTEVKAQVENVEITKDAFNNMDTSLTQLLEHLNRIINNIRNMDDDRKAVLSAVENISAVYQQTAASSSTVNHTAHSQLNLAKELNHSMQELQLSMQDLEKALGLFVI